MLDVAALKDLLRELSSPAARHMATLRLIAAHDFSQRRARRLLKVDPKTDTHLHVERSLITPFEFDRFAAAPADRGAPCSTESPR